MTKKTSAEYLGDVVAAKSLGEESQELKDLRAARDRVEKTLRAELGNDPTIRYGGSHAKGTMVLTSYDLDLLCYFPRDADDAGDTLEELYDSVKKALEKDYAVEPKRSALCVLDKKAKSYLRIDVVPGRFVDGTKTDVFLHQNGGDKARLKTNPDTHISHVRDSGVVSAIKLAKIWRDRYGVTAKTFVLELLVIKILSGQEDDALDVQMRRVLEEFRDHADDLSVVDPANSHNDLSGILDEARDSLQSTAEQSLELIDEDGWEAVFGLLDDEAESDSGSGKAGRIAAAVATDRTRIKPWVP